MSLYCVKARTGALLEKAPSLPGWASSSRNTISRWNMSSGITPTRQFSKTVKSFQQCRVARMSLFKTDELSHRWRLQQSESSVDRWNQASHPNLAGEKSSVVVSNSSPQFAPESSSRHSSIRFVFDFKVYQVASGLSSSTGHTLWTTQSQF